MPTTPLRYESLEARFLSWCMARLRSRSCGVASAVAFVAGGSYFFFAWSPTVHHLPYWTSPGDIWLTLATANAVAHGHLSSIYVHRAYHIGSFRFVNAFVSFPGIVFVLTPIAALSSALHLSADVVPYGIVHPLSHPQTWIVLGPYVLVLSTIPLLACDALAQWLGADIPRRLLLAVAEVVALWNVTVWWGHPEDALAVGLAVYGLLFALKGRWSGAGWLFGIALALQPLVVLAFPVFLALAGTKRWAGFLARGLVAPIVVLIGPLVTNFKATFAALTQQPNFPTFNHQTPWTALAPRVHGLGEFAVQAGPGRVGSIVLACGLGWWVLRWRDRPDLVVWSVALALALRCFTESVMDPYYLWPALAVAMVASVCIPLWRFSSVLVVAIFVTLASQWHLAWAAWWSLNVGGVIIVLVCAIPLGVIELTRQTPIPPRFTQGHETGSSHLPSRERRPESVWSRSRDAARSMPGWAWGYRVPA